MKQEAIRKQGKIIEALPALAFRIRLEDDSEVLAHLSGKMRLNKIQVLIGDNVTVELSPYDKTRGRIVYRTK